MKSALIIAAATWMAAAPGSHALAADLSREAISAATLDDWNNRRAAADEKAQADAPSSADAPMSADARSSQDASETEPVAETAPLQDASAEPKDISEEQEAGKPPVEPDPFLIRLQVLLDRAHASPGVIDGFFGENTVKAVRAYEEMRDLPADGEPDAEMWAVLAVDQGEAMRTYEITQDDLAQPFVQTIPDDYAELAKLDHLGFRGPSEMLAERFHLDEDLLKALNPDKDFSKAGTTILVPDTGSEPETKVARIVVDKGRGELLAYDADGKLVLVDPASIGSEDTPSPSGEVKVEGVAPEPTYSYDPSKNFKQGKNNEKLTIPAGPNGPVGSVWIDLAKPTYGIHGTPEPSHIDKSGSHGCVRLTNWDAEALSKLVQNNKTIVVFKD